MDVRKKKIFKVLVSIIPVLLFLSLCLIFWVHYRIASIVPSSLSNEIATPLLLSHRGYFAKYPENSIESVGAALDMGFRGVEVDCFYYPDKGLVVQHSPIVGEDGEVSNDVLLLEDLLEEYKDKDVFYWLDSKNLNKSNATAIANKIVQLVKRYGLEKKILLESGNPEALAMVRDAIPEIYVAFLISYSNKPLKHFVCDLMLKYNLALYKFNIISLWHPNYMKAFPLKYSNITVITWTVNDIDDFIRVRSLNPAIVLTDEDWTVELPELYRSNTTEKN